MIHRERTHPEYVEGCFTCRIQDVGMASVPGGTRPGSFRVAHERKFNRDMDRYREARRAGEQPDGVSVEKVEATQKRVESHARAKDKLKEYADGVL